MRSIYKESSFEPLEELENQVHLGRGLTHIGFAAFHRCVNLRSVVLPEGLLEIETSAFAGCKSLGAVRIPKSVVHVGTAAFAR